MKKIIFAALLLISLSGFSQSLPDSIANKQVSITLKMKYHAFIIALMQKGGPDAHKYLNQVVSYVSGNTVDTSLNVTVTVPYKLVATMYLIIGSQQERVTATDNMAIKKSLFIQLSANPAYADLLRIIQAMANRNTEETEEIRNQGVDFILSIK